MIYRVYFSNYESFKGKNIIFVPNFFFSFSKLKWIFLRFLYNFLFNLFVWDFVWNFVILFEILCFCLIFCVEEVFKEWIASSLTCPRSGPRPLRRVQKRDRVWPKKMCLTTHRARICHVSALEVYRKSGNDTILL